MKDELMSRLLDWGVAPEWARWIACDSKGTWTWFESRPKPDTIFGYWYTRYPHKKKEAYVPKEPNTVSTWMHTRYKRGEKIKMRRDKTAAPIQ